MAAVNLEKLKRVGPENLEEAQAVRVCFIRATQAALTASKTSEIYEALEEVRQWGGLLPFARGWIVAEARRLETEATVIKVTSMKQCIELGIPVSVFEVDKDKL